MVKTFVCPKDAGIPVGIIRERKDKKISRDMSDLSNESLYKLGNQRQKRQRDDDKERNSKGGERGGVVRVEDSSKKARKEEVLDLMQEVKEYSSQTFKGLKKKKHKDDELTRLGVQPPKQQTMPFKMAMGIREGRKKRDMKTIERSKDSGVVLKKGLSYQNIKEKYSSKDKKSREERDGLDIGTKKGVFHLKRSRLPANLIRHK